LFSISHKAWLAHEDLAASCLERCLAVSSMPCGARLRDLLYLEASVFLAPAGSKLEVTRVVRRALRGYCARVGTGKTAEALNRCAEALAKADSRPPAVNRNRSGRAGCTGSNRSWRESKKAPPPYRLLRPTDCHSLSSQNPDRTRRSMGFADLPSTPAGSGWMSRTGLLGLMGSIQK